MRTIAFPNDTSKLERNSGLFTSIRRKRNSLFKMFRSRIVCCLLSGCVAGCFTGLRAGHGPAFLFAPQTHANHVHFRALVALFADAPAAFRGSLSASYAKPEGASLLAKFPPLLRLRRHNRLHYTPHTLEGKRGRLRMEDAITVSPPVRRRTKTVPFAEGPRV